MQAQAGLSGFPLCGFIHDRASFFAVLRSRTMDPRKGAVAFSLATFAASHALAAENDDASRRPFGAVHPEVAATVMASPSLPAFQYGAPGPVSGGWGLRAGASVGAFYGGLSFVDFPGEMTCLASFPGGCGSSHGTSWGAEVGYGATFVRWLLIRAMLGAGDYVTTNDGWTAICAADGSGCTKTTFHDSSQNLYLRPGMLVAAMLGPVLIGADVSYLYMPAATRPGSMASSSFGELVLGGQLGARF